jgi:4-aminobutyrate aminotransferase-like enzyme
MQGIVALTKKFPISDVRGRGLMVAVEFGGEDGGLLAKTGVASAVTKAAGRRNMLLLSAGTLISLLALRLGPPRLLARA